MVLDDERNLDAMEQLFFRDGKAKWTVEIMVAGEIDWDYVNLVKAKIKEREREACVVERQHKYIYIYIFIQYIYLYSI